MPWGSSKLLLAGILLDRTKAIRTAEAEVEAEAAATQAVEAVATQAAAEILAAAAPGGAGEDLTLILIDVLWPIRTGETRGRLGRSLESEMMTTPKKGHTEEQIVSVFRTENGSGSSPARPSDILSSGLLSVFVT